MKISDLTPTTANQKKSKVSESKLLMGLIRLLDGDFYIKTECWSVGIIYRIDIILQLKSDPRVVFAIEGKHGEYTRGRDIGRTIIQACTYSVQDFNRNIFSSHDNSTFTLKHNLETTADQMPNYGRIPIFLAPPISGRVFERIRKEQDVEAAKQPHKYSQGNTQGAIVHGQYSKHHTFNGMLGQFNIGEVRNIGRKPGDKGNTITEFIFSYSNYQVYSTACGLHRENYDKIIRHINKPHPIASIIDNYSDIA